MSQLFGIQADHEFVKILFTADLRSFSDFEDPLLVKVEEVSIKQESSSMGATVASKLSVKTEEVEEVLPAKRKRKQTQSVAVTETVARKRGRKATVKAEKVRPEEAYPTPPETPGVSVKLETTEYFAEASVFSLAERVKRGRGARKVQKAE